MDPGLPSFAARLQEAVSTLTPGQRRIADCLMESPREAAFLGVEEVARRSRTSVATVVRFAQHLGYAGYLGLRQALVGEMRAYSAEESRLLQAPDDAARILVEVARRDVQNIERVLQNISERLLEDLVQRLRQARHRLVLGRGISEIMAHHLAYILTFAGLPCISANPADFATQVGTLGPKDLLLLFSLPPYSRSTVDAAAYARKRKVPVIAFTDRLDAPLARPADLVIPVTGENLLFTHSLAAYAVLAHAIGTAVAGQDRESAIRRLREAAQVDAPNTLG